MKSNQNFMRRMAGVYIPACCIVLCLASSAYGWFAEHNLESTVSGFVILSWIANYMLAWNVGNHRRLRLEEQDKQIAELTTLLADSTRMLRNSNEQLEFLISQRR